MTELNNEQCIRFISKLVGDESITDDDWEERYQHLRDDLCGYINGTVVLEELHRFHYSCHGINVLDLAETYGII